MSEQLVQEVEPKQEVATEAIKTEEPSDEVDAVNVNERLLKESKTYKSQAKQLKAELDALREERIEKNGNLEEKVQFYKDQADELGKKLADANYVKTENNLFNKMREVAPDCHNISLIINNPEYESDIKAAVDLETGEIDELVIKSLYEKDKLKNPYLYTKTKLATQVNDVTAPVEQKVKPLSKMTAEEKTKLRAELIKEKYGK